MSLNKARTRILDSLSKDKTGEVLTLYGWVRTFRNDRFIALNDGSTIENIQVVLPEELQSDDLLKKINTGAALKVIGELVESQGKNQDVELVATELEVLGEADPEQYPLQPKKHSMEFLRENAHLRARTNTIAAVMRIRNSLAFATHQFFYQKGFVYLHTPIITASDAEGAGEAFHVTTLPLDQVKKDEQGNVDFSADFFGQETNLTVSGQLEGEAGAQALGNIYTFGPTFRAENSNTSRHLAEFWMIEPEMAFHDLEDNMDLAEEMVKYLIQFVFDQNKADLDFLDKRFADEEKQKPQAQRSAQGLIERLEFVLNNPFERVTYTEAIDILRNSKPAKKGKFKYKVDWGIDMQSEHERYLVEKHFSTPVIVTDYPAAIKAFYMKQNDDGKTVRAMDVLFPGIGEVIGGSQREENLEKLQTRMREMGIPEEELWWYLDLRRFGSTPHSGFGLGFERIVLFVTGMGNIRDVIPFPRTPGNAKF